MQNFYTVGDRFQLRGTAYQIKTITNDAIEIASTPEQSLWKKREAFEVQLGIAGKCGLFNWQYRHYLPQP